MIKPGVLVYYVNAFHEVCRDQIGFVTRERDVIGNPKEKIYYVKWARRDCIDTWYTAQTLFEVLREDE